MTSDEKRAEFIAQMRALTDLLEREPSLPIPYCMDGTGYPSHRGASGPEKVTAVFEAAAVLGTEVEYDRVHGTVTTRLEKDGVRYSVYAKVGPRPAQSDTVIVSDPSQVLGAESVAS